MLDNGVDTDNAPDQELIGQSVLEPETQAFQGQVPAVFSWTRFQKVLKECDAASRSGHWWVEE